MDAPSDHLAKKFLYRRDEFIAALGNPDFYIEVTLIGIALALAFIMAILIRRRFVAHLKAHPPKRIDAEFITRPLLLLGPLLALLYLSVIKPLAEEYSSTGGDWTDATIQLCIAWLIAKAVLLIVRSRPVAWFIAIVVMIVGVLRATGFIHSTVVYLKSMGFDIGQYHISMLNLVHGVVILVVVFWIAGALSRTLESYLRRSSALSYNARELVLKFFRIFLYFLAIMITLSALGVDLTAFAVFGGALGVGIGLGLQKITANFVSGITLLMEKSIRIGDMLEIGGQTGWVRQLNMRYTLLETPDGREVLIPNEELMSTRVINWTHSSNHARIEIKVNVSYASDPAKVRELMTQAAREHKLCLKDPAPNCYLREFGENAMQFQLFFWIADVQEGRLGPQSDVMISILDKFRKGGIAIPCPAAANKPENL
ncbi:MAG: mechanosensitive ion channel [Pseudomonadota bacterium]|nr:mechanosensitive ion channel [Pseudomonadota bacterium]